jgi:hypothetical protein
MPIQPITGQSIYSCVTPKRLDTSVNWLIVKKGGNFTLIQENALNNMYLAIFKEKLTPVFSKVISNLKKQKEHLALQLNFEFGNISQEDFNKQEENYLVEPEKIPVQKLTQDIEIFLTFSGVPMDSEDIAEAFNCQTDTAEEALQTLLFKDGPDAGIPS